MISPKKASHGSAMRRKKPGRTSRYAQIRAVTRQLVAEAARLGLLGKAQNQYTTASSTSTAKSSRAMGLSRTSPAKYWNSLRAKRPTLRTPSRRNWAAWCAAD